LPPDPTRMEHRRIQGEKFILKPADARGVTVWGWYEDGDDRLHYQVVQEVPDEFFQQTKEQDVAWSPNEKRKSHYQKFASIPMQVRQNWHDELGVKGFGQDPDADKEMLKRLNSTEFQKLRTGGGKL
jgi:hypothetical protein